MRDCLLVPSKCKNKQNRMQPQNFARVICANGIKGHLRVVIVRLVVVSVIRTVIICSFRCYHLYFQLTYKN